MHKTNLKLNKKRTGDSNFWIKSTTWPEFKVISVWVISLDHVRYVKSLSEITFEHLVEKTKQKQKQTNKHSEKEKKKRVAIHFGKIW